MPLNDVLDHEELTRILTENFKIIADEVHFLNDRNLILENKLRFAQESFQGLADEHATTDPEIFSTLAKLQLHTDLTHSEGANIVPLPSRTRPSSSQEAAVAIRDGRRAIQRLAVLERVLKSSTASGQSVSGVSSNRLPARLPSLCLSTVLEQDFTVPGKKSSLLCPYAPQKKEVKPTTSDPTIFQSGSTMKSNRPLTPSESKDQTPHHSADPICAAMYAETMNSPPPSVTASIAKCPIRFLNRHSPEEVAQYFETHKHEIPRSHEVCVKRYQRNESDIRKLDAKYGNLVNMIQGLGAKHQPMLPSKDEAEAGEDMSNERVENWAQAVSSEGINDDAASEPAEDSDRETRFDRPLKEIRVGESPSRPWGISVPSTNPPTEHDRAVSPPPAPVSAEHVPKLVGRCPFGFDQQANIAVEGLPSTESVVPDIKRPAGKCPVAHKPVEATTKESPSAEAQSRPQFQPVFVQPECMKPANGVPQMVFTGPVFIGYPIEQAMALMQQWKATR
ncbi:hypothetical protein BJ878DRAFT_411823 [Calycina marina]|uniref:Uncharacterized protein n=1 Tax=Calycina marina TaxID=1763456 RepID=A0A9P7ZBH3_9HELO|nr:hypothetical protein BJ878DRAFT_411823 [Calycina marina]